MSEELSILPLFGLLRVVGALVQAAGQIGDFVPAVERSLPIRYGAERYLFLRVSVSFSVFLHFQMSLTDGSEVAFEDC